MAFYGHFTHYFMHRMTDKFALFFTAEYIKTFHVKNTFYFEILLSKNLPNTA